MKVLVSGGRNFTDTFFVWKQLHLIHIETPISEVIQGKARGVDTMAAQWAIQHMIKTTGMPADWDRYGKSAGYQRNAEMADLKPDLVIIFPGGKGTAMMKKIALEKGLKVHDVSHLHTT